MEQSPFTDTGPVRLQVRTGSQLAEVFLVDRRFALVERAIGDLDSSVPQGVYLVKARVGDAISEGWHVLNADRTIDLSGELSVASPVPVFGTTRTHEYHAYPAEQQSRDVTSVRGSGAEVYLCARRWTDVEPAVPGGQEPAPPPLSLHRPDGSIVVDVGEGQASVGAGDPMVGIAVQVDPGPYLVRWQTASGVEAEQTVIVVEGWQTQVFLLEERQAPGAGPIADDPLAGVSVQMTRVGSGFDPDDRLLRVSEEARVALASERPVASGEVSEALFAKFESPMTGLFGAHLMLLAHERQVEATDEERRHGEKSTRPRAPVSFDQQLYDHVVDNLGGLLGPEHPDVTALATRASDKDLSALRPVELPPMLWRSWLLLIEASNERPELVPVSTWRRALTLVPLRPFLVWSPHEGSELVDTWKREAKPFVQASQRAPRTRGRGPAAMALPGPGGADETRRLSMQLLAPRAALDELSGDLPG